MTSYCNPEDYPLIWDSLFIPNIEPNPSLDSSFIEHYSPFRPIRTFKHSRSSIVSCLFAMLPSSRCTATAPLKLTLYWLIIDTSFYWGSTPETLTRGERQTCARRIPYEAFLIGLMADERSSTFEAERNILELFTVAGEMVFLSGRAKYQ